MQQRADDAVGRARHPAGIGCAPIGVVGVKVKRVQAGDVVHHDGAVHVDGPFGRTRGPAGEVQQSRVIGGGGLDRRVLIGRVHRLPEVQRARRRAAGLAVIDDEDVPHRRQPITDLGDLALIDRPRCHQDVGAPDVDPGGNRFGPEGREQRRDHAAVAQRAQHRDVELRGAAHEGEHAIAFVDAQRAQHAGESPGEPAELGVTDVAGGDHAVPGAIGDKPQRRAARGRAHRVPVQGGVGDVAHAGTHALAQIRYIGPVELGALVLVVREVGPNTVVSGCLADDVHKKGPRVAWSSSSFAARQRRNRDKGHQSRRRRGGSNDPTLGTKDPGARCPHA